MLVAFSSADGVIELWSFSVFEYDWYPLLQKMMLPMTRKLHGFCGYSPFLKFL